MNKKLNTNGMRSRSNSDKLNKMMQKLASQMNQKDLRMDISEWLETCSEDMSNSRYIITVVQRPGSQEQQILPQEYKNLKAACMDSTRVIAEIVADCGARSITTDIRSNRFYVTTENNVRITLVLD